MDKLEYLQWKLLYYNVKMHQQKGGAHTIPSEITRQVNSKPQAESNQTIYKMGPSDTLLGRGGFGSVYLKTLNNTKYVIKEFTDVNYGRYENLVLNLFDDCLDFFLCKETYVEADNKGYLVTRYIDNNGTVSEYFISPSVSQNEKIDFCIELLNILGVLRDRKIVHGDIKPDNILVNNNGSPILIDFGTACVNSRDMGLRDIECPDDRGSIPQTPSYADIMMYSEGYNQYEYDVWSMVLVIIFIFTNIKIVNIRNTSQDLARYNYSLKGIQIRIIKNILESHSSVLLRYVESLLTIEPEERSQRWVLRDIINSLEGFKGFNHEININSILDSFYWNIQTEMLNDDTLSEEYKQLVIEEIRKKKPKQGDSTVQRDIVFTDFDDTTIKKI